MFKCPALTTVEHRPRPNTSVLSLDYDQAKMSSSPSMLTKSKLEPPPNLVSPHQNDEEVVGYPQFILLGDSITQFSTLTFQAYLQTLYIRRVDIINRGFSGFTAPMGYRAMKKVIPPSTSQSSDPTIKLVTVFYGANDACIPGESQHVDLPRYIKTIQKIVEYSVFTKRNCKIVVITPPPVNEHQFSQLPSGGFQRRAGRTSQYARALFEKFEGAQEVHMLDFWSILMRKVGWTDNMGRDCCCEHLPETPQNQGAFQHIPGCYHCPLAPNNEYQLSDFLCDGLHLTKLGYDILFDAFVKLVRKDIPECAPENMPYVLPEWRDALTWDEASDSD